MAYQFLGLEFSDWELSDRRRCRSAHITFNAPPMNSLSQLFLSDISDAIAEAEKEACRLILLTGMPETKAFIAGADITVMKNFSPEEAKEFITLGQGVINKLESSTMISIAAINGFALGGGLELALACDIRFLSDKAIVGLPEVGLGVIPAFGGTQRLSRMIGEANAKYLILTGNHISATEAFRLGIAQEVISHDQLLVESENKIRKILSNGPLAVSSAKYLVHSSFDTQLEQGLQNEKEHFGKLFASGEANEGLSAFINKRKPKFSN